MEDVEKEIIYKWGYEHEDWWKPIQEALQEAYNQGAKDKLNEIRPKVRDKFCEIYDDDHIRIWNEAEDFMNSLISKNSGLQ